LNGIRQSCEFGLLGIVTCTADIYKKGANGYFFCEKYFFGEWKMSVARFATLCGQKAWGEVFAIANKKDMSLCEKPNQRKNR
jgi:hypothetical protein